MTNLKRRVQKLEKQFKDREKGVYTVFEQENKMKIIIDSQIVFEGESEQGEKVLSNLEDSSLIVRFNIPRPETA